ncbi:MAG TPA: hypothetical protein VMU89_02665 [Thermomicrobiaceae bacterium]|nr:hypothetical protein [Thermomicrobiaceae bacterium]
METVETMETVEREAWSLLSDLVESLRVGPVGRLEQFLAVPLSGGGGLLAHPGAIPIHVPELASIDTLVEWGYLELERTPHGLSLLTISAAGFAANLAHHEHREHRESNEPLPVH